MDGIFFQSYIYIYVDGYGSVMSLKVLFLIDFKKVATQTTLFLVSPSKGSIKLLYIVNFKLYIV